MEEAEVANIVCRILDGKIRGYIIYFPVNYPELASRYPGLNYVYLGVDLQWQDWIIGSPEKFLFSSRKEAETALEIKRNEIKPFKVKGAL
jgi:hypothetical protein